MISESARARFHRTIQAAIDAGAERLAGGALLPGPGWFYPPTVLRADTRAPEEALAGAFGPVVLVRGVASADAAVDAANASPFGLAASVWGRDLRAARAVARRLEAGMVAVNEAVTTAGHAAAPFGGVKASGFGRTKGALGLRNSPSPRPSTSAARGDSAPTCFPTAGTLERLLKIYRMFFHRALERAGSRRSVATAILLRGRCRGRSLDSRPLCPLFWDGHRRLRRHATNDPIRTSRFLPSSDRSFA